MLRHQKLDPEVTEIDSIITSHGVVTNRPELWVVYTTV
uniref:Transposase n=1 Tax=Echinococcus granulosus TaxID=6210 RepID=A0A068X0H7_ECHGR|nr:hypothetical protein EgrG_000912000 [Echinococcus granulosus]